MTKLYVARNPRVAARSLDGEMMIMSGRDSTLFTLNKTATILWQSADGILHSTRSSSSEFVANFPWNLQQPFRRRNTRAGTGEPRDIEDLGRADHARNSRRWSAPMSGLLEEMSAKALRLNIPLNVQLDLTYRCNERCVHCYLDHDDHGEMTTAEIKHLLDEMAAAGGSILTLSGGEIFLRKDFFEILEHARRLMFCVKLKTNAF